MVAAAKRELIQGDYRRLLLGGAMVSLAGFVFFALWRGRPPDIAAAFPRGEIVVGVDASYPPFALDDGGSLSGLDIDLARAIAEEIGLPLRFNVIGYYSLYDALISGEVDLLISALRVDSARTDDVKYTDSYFDNGLLMVGDAIRSPAIDSLSGKRIAYEFASSADSQLREWEREGHVFESLPYELPDHALDALRLSQADAALVDATAFRLYLGARPAWPGEYVYISYDPYALAVRRDRVDSWKLVQSALAALKESGELARISDVWF